MTSFETFLAYFTTCVSTKGFVSRAAANAFDEVPLLRQNSFTGLELSRSRLESSEDVEKIRASRPRRTALPAAANSTLATTELDCVAARVHRVPELFSTSSRRRHKLKNSAVTRPPLVSCYQPTFKRNGII